jgi:hypothetical protein
LFWRTTLQHKNNDLAASGARGVPPRVKILVFDLHPIWGSYFIGRVKVIDFNVQDIESFVKEFSFEGASKFW